MTRPDIVFREIPFLILNPLTGKKMNRVPNRCVKNMTLPQVHDSQAEIWTKVRRKVHKIGFVVDTVWGISHTFLLRNQTILVSKSSARPLLFTWTVVGYLREVTNKEKSQQIDSNIKTHLKLRFCEKTSWFWRHTRNCVFKLESRCQYPNLHSLDAQDIQVFYCQTRQKCVVYFKKYSTENPNKVWLFGMPTIFVYITWPSDLVFDWLAQVEEVRLICKLVPFWFLQPFNRTKPRFFLENQNGM